MKWIKRASYSLLAVFLLLLLGGTFAAWPMLTFPIAQIDIQRLPAQPSQPPESPAGLLAGIAERDITPPIGIPKMGYSAWAREADGFRNRLKARAFYLKTPDTDPVVVVQADLPASSLVLRHKIAEKVAAATDIPFPALSLHVTHTHSGPGQYYESDFYNTFGSNKPGFDPDVFNFLVDQISAAVIEARQSRRPAKVAVGETEIYGATKNRSIGAYIKNNNVTDKRIDDYAALRAVNPKITLVRIDVQDTDGTYKPRGAFSTFAIHGTGIPPFTHPYHGDVWTFFERDLEYRISGHYHPTWKPIHGPFEANHGDNNPNYRTGLRGDTETRRIGLMLAKQAWTVFRSLDDKLTDTPVIRHAMREIDLLNPRGDENQPLCDRPIVGTATAGAAHGDEVFPLSYLPPFAAGWPKRFFKDNCHTEKNWMLSWLQVWGLQPTRYPHLVNATALQIDDLVLIGLPFEITFESGNRIRQAVTTALQQNGVSANRIVISSHTNGFFGYSTTPEEYTVQYYEGGHTLYGPGTTQFLASTASRLSTDMLKNSNYADLPTQWRFNLAAHHFFPTPATATGKRAQQSEAEFNDNYLEQESYWAITYTDVNPSQLAIHQPLMHMEIRSNAQPEWQPLILDHQPVTDEGYDLQIRLLDDAPDNMALYQLRWYNPPVAAEGTQFRIVVAERQSQEIFYSKPFGS